MEQISQMSFISDDGISRITVWDLSSISLQWFFINSTNNMQLFLYEQNIKLRKIQKSNTLYISASIHQWRLLEIFNI